MILAVGINAQGKIILEKLLRFWQEKNHHTEQISHIKRLLLVLSGESYFQDEWVSMGCEIGN